MFMDEETDVLQQKLELMFPDVTYKREYEVDPDNPNNVLWSRKSIDYKYHRARTEDRDPRSHTNPDVSGIRVLISSLNEDSDLYRSIYRRATQLQINNRHWENYSFDLVREIKILELERKQSGGPGRPLDQVRLKPPSRYAPNYVPENDSQLTHNLTPGNKSSLRPSYKPDLKAPPRALKPKRQRINLNQQLLKIQEKYRRKELKKEQQSP
jgi:hypothetical protein